MPFFLSSERSWNFRVSSSSLSIFSPKNFKTTPVSIPTSSNIARLVKVFIAACPSSGLLSSIFTAISAARPGFSKTLNTVSSCSTADGPISVLIFARTPRVACPVDVVGSNIPIKEVNVFGSMFPAAT